MTKRKTRYRASYLLMILIVIAVLVVINVLGAARFKRFDLTENKMFTVSPAMRQILRELPDVVTVTYYVSEDLPEEFRGVRRETLDFFQELERASGGNFKYRVVDVPQAIFDEQKRRSDAGLTKLSEELDAERIPPVSLGVQRAAGAEERLIYSTMTVAYLDKPKEFIHAYQDPLRLEYELATILVRLSQVTKPVVAFFDGKPKFTQVLSRSPHMPPQRVHEFSLLTELLRQYGPLERVEWREITLSNESPIPDDAACLIVAQPSELNERQKYEISRFISGGGNAIFFVAEYAVDTMGGRMPFPVEANTPNLNDLFESWGLTIGPELVADNDTGVELTVWTPVGRALRAKRQWMPVFLLLTGEYLDQESPLTTRLRGLFFRNATPIVLDEKTLEQNGIVARTLARSSASSWLLPVAGSPFLSPFMFGKPNEADFKGPQKLAVVLQGTFPFKYAEEPVPEWPEPAPPVEDAPNEGEGPQTHLPPVPAEDAASAAVEEGSDVSDEATSEAVEPVVKGAVIAPSLDLKPATVVVVSTADLIKISEEDARGNPELTKERLTFLSNAIETLSLGQALVSIRAKTRTIKPFEESSEARMTAYTLINLLAVPLVVVVLGVVRYVSRRRSRRTYRERGVS